MEYLDEHSIQKSYSQSKHVKIIGRSLNSTHTLKPNESKVKPKVISTSKSRSRLIGKKTSSIDPSPIRSTSKKKKPSDLPSMSNLSSPLHIISSKDPKKRKTSKGPKAEKPQKKFKKQETVENQLKTEENTQEGRKSRTKLRELTRRCSAEQIKPVDTTKQKNFISINVKDHCVESNDKPRPETTDLKKLKKVESNSKKSPSKKPGLIKLNSEQDIQSYIKDKKKRKNFEKIQKKIQEEQKEHERILGLISLEKQRKSSKTRKKSKVKGGKTKLIGLKSLRKKKPNEKIELKNLTEDFRGVHKNENLGSNSSDESYLSTGLRTDRDDWINLLDKKFTGSNSEFVEEFKEKMEKSMMKIERIIEVHEQGCEKSEKSSSGYSDFGEIVVKPPSVLVGSLGSSIKPPVPPLSLSLLKNTEFYSDSSEGYSDYIINKEQSESSESSEEEEDYSKTKSENSTQWIIDVVSVKSAKSDAKNKENNEKIKVPALKRLDLNKVEVEKSEESFSQSENLNELVKMKSPRKHLVQGNKEVFIMECFKDDEEIGGRGKVGQVSGMCEGNSGVAKERNGKDSGRVGNCSERSEKLSEDSKKSGKDFKKTEKLWKKFEKYEESGESSSSDEFGVQSGLKKNFEVEKSEKIKSPEKIQAENKEKSLKSPNGEFKGAGKVDLLIKKKIGLKDYNETEEFSKTVQHEPTKSESVSNSKDLLGNSNSKIPRKLSPMAQIHKKIEDNSPIKQPQRPTLLPSPKDEFKPVVNKEEKQINKPITSKVQENDKSFKVPDPKTQNLKTQTLEKNNLLFKTLEKCLDLPKNPEKTPNVPDQHTEKQGVAGVHNENSSKKSEFPSKVAAKPEQTVNCTEKNSKLPESHEKLSEPKPNPSCSMNQPKAIDKRPNKLITTSIQDPKKSPSFEPEEVVKAIIAEDLSIETPISSDSLFTPLEKTKLSKVKAGAMPEELKSDERKSDSSSMPFDALQTSIINLSDYKLADLTSESVSPSSITSPTKKPPDIQKIEEKLEEHEEQTIENHKEIKQNIKKTEEFTENIKKPEEIQANLEESKQNPRNPSETLEKPVKVERIEKFQTVKKDPEPKKDKNKALFSTKFLENSGDLSSDRTKKLFNSTKNLIKHSQNLQTKPDSTSSTKPPLPLPQNTSETPEFSPKPPTSPTFTPPSPLPKPSDSPSNESLTNPPSSTDHPAPSQPQPHPHSTKLSDSSTKELSSTQVFTSDLFKSFNPFADSSSSDINLSRSEESSPLISPKLSTFRSLLSEDWSSEISALLLSEISVFLRLVSFKDCEKEVDTSLEFIMEYLNTMANELKENEFEVLDAINTPVYHEPLARLFSFQDPKNPILMKFPTLELILPPDLCSELKVRFESLELPTRQIYLQMLFDCVNEALNYIRPFGVIGIPDPWSTHPRILFGEAELENVFNRIVSYMVKWATSKSGAYHTAETSGDEDHLQSVREEKMSSLLCVDIKDEDSNWTYYEEEETQAKILTGNAIFDSLIDEILSILK